MAHGDAAMTRAFLLALKLWAALHLVTSDSRDLARDIAAEARDDYETALVAYYVALESGVRIRPNAVSWDASMGVSCGPLQLPCPYVTQHTPREQIRWWLREVRAGHLENLDSSAPRAWRRFSRAMALLARVRTPGTP
jgi:hypothetical protein